MFKLAGLILDPYDDPAFVDHPRTAVSLPTPDEVARLPDRDFAVVIKTAAGTHRKYPVATPNLLKVSSAYFDEFGAQLPEDIRAAVHCRLADAARRFNVKLAGAAAAPPPDATCFVFSLASEAPASGPARAPATKLAAAAIVQDELIRNFVRMTPSERALAVADLCKTAEVTDPRLTPYRPRDVFGGRLSEGLRQREFVLADEPIKLAQFEALLDDLPKLGARAAAVMLDRFDRSAGLTGRVIDAYVTCWDGVEKRAAADPMQRQHAAIERLATQHAHLVQQTLDEPTASAFLRAPFAFWQSAPAAVKKLLTRMADAAADGGTRPRRRITLPAALQALREGSSTC